MGKEKSSLFRATSTVGLLTLLSRLLGFLRDLLVARAFGASFYADAFLVAFRIPNLLRSVFAEGAMTSAFIPVFSDELKKGHNEASKALSSLLSFLLLTSTIVSGIGIFLAPTLIKIFAPGFSTEAQSLSSSLLELMFPYLVFVSLVVLVNGALNSVGVFGASAWAQVWMNVALICGALWADSVVPVKGVLILALSVLVGGIVQVAMQIPALRSAGFSLWALSSPFGAVTKKVVILMLPALVGASVYQLQIFVGTMLASSLGEGRVTWLYYADRLVQLPVGVFSIALGSVLLPMLARAERSTDFERLLQDALRFSIFLMLPFSVFLLIFSQSIVELVFMRGAFSPHDATQTAGVLQAYCIGLLAVSVQTQLIRAFIARKDTVTPTMIGIVTLIVNFVLGLALMGPTAVGTISALQSFLPLQFNLGISGLALSSSLATWVSLAITWVLFRLRTPAFAPHPIGGIFWRSLLASGGVVVACIFVSEILCSPSETALIVSENLRSSSGMETRFERLGFLAAGLILSVIFCSVIFFLLKTLEFKETLQLLWRVIYRGDKNRPPARD